MLYSFTKGGNCGCFVLINKWCSWEQSALCAIQLYVQSRSDGFDHLPKNAHLKAQTDICKGLEHRFI